MKRSTNQPIRAFTVGKVGNGFANGDRNDIVIGVTTLGLLNQRNRFTLHRGARWDVNIGDDKTVRCVSVRRQRAGDKAIREGIVDSDMLGSQHLESLFVVVVFEV